MTSVSYPMSDPFAASRYPSPPFSPSPADSPPLNIDGPIAPPPRQRPASTHITPFVPPLSPPSESQMPAGRYPAPLHSSAQSASTTSNARKRQSHNPSALPSESPPKAATPEYVLHPSIAAYQSAHPRRPLVGFGPYILLQTLGEGEFGKVKLGVQTEYGEEVAVKLIRRGSVDNEARLSKVEREIEVLKSVRHPNIVRLFDVIETEKYIGIILDFANGGELFDHILAHRYLKEKDAAKLFAQLISGVHYLHRKHIIHRDLKLENLLLDKHRNVIITDFGFANRFEHAKDDLMATSCGSPCYAAPELVISEGLYVGSAVDIWSCGVILYAMLSGYLPFDDDPNNPDGDNINLLYRYIVNTPLTFPDYITLEAQDLLRRMLVPDPMRRCDLQTVMAHPWLRAYTSLFKLSVSELELVSQEQLQNKRAASRRDMQARVRQQEQAYQKAVLARSQSSHPGLGGVTAGSLNQQHRRAREPRHHSALPGTTTVPYNLHRATAGGSPTMPPAVKRTKTDFESHDAVRKRPVTPPIDENRLSEQRTPTRSRATSLRSSPTKSTGAQDIDGPAEDAKSAISAERVAASANPNRHTIQVEYDSEAAYEKLSDLLGDEGASRVRSDNTEVGQRLSSSPSAFAPSSNLSSTGPTGEVAVAVTSGASDISRSSTLTSQSSSFGADVSPGHSPPRQGRSLSPPDTPRASSTSQTQQVRLSPSTPRASSKTATSVPPPLSAAATRNNQVFAKLPPLPVSSQGDGASKRDRSRKGMSMDRFGLGKLLGVTTSANIDRSGSIRSSPGSNTDDLDKNKASSSLLSRKDAPRSTEAKQARRKTLTLMVAEPFNRSATTKIPPRTANSHDGQKEHTASSSNSTVGSRPGSMVIQADRIVSPGPQDRTLSSPSVTAVDAFARQDSPKEEPRGVQRSASSSAAKKVMDWFRRKSLARETLTDLREVPNAGTASSPQKPKLPVAFPATVQMSTTTPTVVITDLAHEVTAENSESHPTAPSPPSLADSARPGSQRTATTEQAVGSRLTMFDSRLKVHSGVVDQSALTSRPVPEVLADVLRVLHSMGIDVKKESDYRFRCTRARKRKSGATTGLGLSSVMSKGSSASGFVAMSASSSSVDRRGLPMPSAPSGLLASASGGLKGMLLRRGSSYSTSPTPDALVSAADVGSPSGSSTGLASPVRPVSPLVPEPLYGEHSLDVGDEIRFSVELTRIRNLPGLYSLDIKRLRGNVWSFKFVYQTILDRSETLTH